MQQFSIGPGITGTWVSTDHPQGSGFGLEVLDGNLFVIEWYAFGRDGGQMYVGGIGPITGNTATIDVFQTVGPGARFFPHFVDAQAHAQKWGTVTATFNDCNSGQISWVSLQSEFGSGSVAITRLTQPAGLSCP